MVYRLYFSQYNFEVDFNKRTARKEVLKFCHILKSIIILKHENKYRQMLNSINMLKKLLALNSVNEQMFNAILNRISGPYCANRDIPESYCKKQDLAFKIKEAYDTNITIDFNILVFYYNKTLSCPFKLCTIKWLDCDPDWLVFDSSIIDRE
jgi:hypothetical protein